MTKRYLQYTTLLLASFLAVIGQFLAMPNLLAASPNVVISEVTTEGSNASQEFIELHNNSSADVSLEGWTIQLRSSSNGLNKTLALSKTLFGYSYSLLASTSHEACLVADFPCFSSGMSTSGGHVVLLDSSGSVVDKLGWGSATNPESSSATVPVNGESLTRKVTGENVVLQDSDNNLVDFQSMTPSPVAGGVYTPESDCRLARINEILPNPEGEDGGKEYVEIFNASDKSLNLDNCSIRVDTINHPLSGTFNPGDYLVITGITLPNSAGGQVALITATGELTVDYPGGLSDDESYSYIDDSWYRGAKPTPGDANALQAGPIAVSDQSEEDFEPCPEGKYRNPDTNRCRNIEVGSSLTPCGPGQVRSPETNRCRNSAVALKSLAPCDPGQTRNPATNRCRKSTSTSSSLAACQKGQQRNPDTNRCRKVASTNSTNPMTNPAKATSKPVSYYVLGIVAALGVAYGVYEYRQNIRNLFNKRRPGK